MTMNTLDLSYYKVSINPTGLGGLAPADGFIDNLNPENYLVFASTLPLSEAKERANMRWKAIERQVSLTISPISVINVLATGADQDTEATLFEATFCYDREEYIQTDDELAPGILTGNLAVKRWVARAMIQDITENRYAYDPTTVTAGHQKGPEIKEINAAPLAADIATAEAALTVTLVTL